MAGSENAEEEARLAFIGSGDFMQVSHSRVEQGWVRGVVQSAWCRVQTAECDTVR